MFDALALASGFQLHQHGSDWTPRRHPKLNCGGNARCTLHVWVDPRFGTPGRGPTPIGHLRLQLPGTTQPGDRRSPPTAAQAAPSAAPAIAEGGGVARKPSRAPDSDDSCRAFRAPVPACRLQRGSDG